MVPVIILTTLGFILSQPYPGIIPTNVPQPCEPGGGGLPTVPSPTLAASLALVPPGLIAVSVFPPWAFQRTVEAVGVIFKEAPGKIHLLHLKL